MTVLSKLSDRFTEVDIDDEIVVMRLDNGDFFSLGGTGAVIWRLIDGTRDRAALLRELAGDYGADERDIAEDVDDLLGRLKEQGLVGG